MLLHVRTQARACCCAFRFASMLRARACACRWGPPTPVPLPGAAPANENTHNIKHLLQHTSETGETFEIYTCNISVYLLQHMQHPDNTLATYV